MYSEAGENERLTSVFDKTQQFLFAVLYLAMPHGIWDPGFLNRDGIHTPCSGSIES